MNRYTVLVLGLSLGLGAACSSSSDEHAPAVSDGGASQAGAGGSRNGSGGNGSGGRNTVGGGRNTVGGDAGSGGAADQAGAAGSASEGGAGGLEQGMIVPVTPTACPVSGVWGAAMPLMIISTAASERLLSITADELDIIFLRGADLFRAHRSGTSTAFGTPVPVTVPEGYSAADGATLSADGKTLVLIAASGQSFAALTRASRTGSFSTTPDPSAFDTINVRSAQTLEHYAAPVLAPDGKSFVFSAFTPEPGGGFPDGQTGVSRVYEAAWSGAAWATPESISQDLFDGTTAARPLPSGLSSDSRTLFYFDEASSKQIARFRDRPDAPLSTEVDIGDRMGAVPNAKCDVIYYSSAGDVLFDSQ